MQSGFAATKFLTISDIHYGSDNANNDGQDTGNEFLKITMGKLKTLSKDADFIINLGDLPTHLLWDTSRKGEYEQKVFHELYQADIYARPMFYIAGNNDSLAGNYQPFEVNGKSPLDLAWDWDGACAYCEGLVIDDSPMRRGGYYSTYVVPNNKDIILIALNSTPWATAPILLPKYPDKQNDAMEQLDWLEKQLKAHHAKQLLLAMHAPPGASFLGDPLWEKRYQEKFISLLEQNHNAYDQITLLISHTHMDEFRKIIFHDGTSVYAYSTPAVSRIYHNNPGIKLFSLDTKMAVTNFTTFYSPYSNVWADDSYSAMGSAKTIFPDCHASNLADCLDTLSNEQVCHYLEKGLFYGVKSERIKGKHSCSTIYAVDSLSQSG